MDRIRANANIRVGLTLAAFAVFLFGFVYFVATIYG